MQGLAARLPLLDNQIAKSTLSIALLVGYDQYILIVDLA